jgi:hypothetical protein
LTFTDLLAQTVKPSKNRSNGLFEEERNAHISNTAQHTISHVNFFAEATPIFLVAARNKNANNEISPMTSAARVIGRPGTAPFA